jgi:hypothetical protein
VRFRTSINIPSTNFQRRRGEEREKEKAGRQGIAEGVSAKHHTSCVMSDPILILYPYTWIDRFMSRVTSTGRARAFSSDTADGIGGRRESTELVFPSRAELRGTPLR